LNDGRSLVSYKAVNRLRINCLSFDCYGTLIDWETGLLQALRALHARYRLIILSNIDDDLFRYSQERLGVEQDEILHVAQSLYHDVAPANRLGISTAWVNRRRGQAGSGATPAAEARPDLEAPDLTTLVESLTRN